MKTDSQKITGLVDLSDVQTSTHVRPAENCDKGRVHCALRKMLLVAGVFAMAGYIQVFAADAPGNPTNAAPSTPTLSGRMLPSGFQLEISGGTGSYTLQSSADLGFRDPQCVTNFEAGTNALSFVDCRAIQLPALYYRIVPNALGSITNQPPVSNQPPVIVTQPKSTNVVQGGKATFQAAATGTAPLHYQWYGPASTLIPGATTATLTLSNIQPSAAGSYHLFVTNAYGFAQSSNAVLTVLATTNQPPVSNQAPVIVTQPKNTNVVQGGNATFQAAGTGTAPLHYQWYGPASTLIPGATTATLTLSNIQPSAAGAYYLSITNAYGFAQSSNAVLTVLAATNQPPVSNQAPVIVTQPKSTNVVQGGNATFQAAATGTASLHYQWYGPASTLIPGATTATLTLSNIQPSAAGAYYLFVTNAYGFAQSSNAVLTVLATTNQPPVSNQAPAIITQPKNTNVVQGGNAMFQATATGTGPLHYQWYGPASALIPGATSSTLTLSNIQPSAAGSYYLFVTNAYGFAQSSNAVLTVLAATNQPPITYQAPVVVTQPKNTNVVQGSHARFQATATGTAPLHYQWYGPGSTLIPGAITATLTLSNVQPSATGSYFMFVTNQFGFAQSSNAVLTVTGP
jgi:hypothetical protein